MPDEREREPRPGLREASSNWFESMVREETTYSLEILAQSGSASEVGRIALDELQRRNAHEPREGAKP